MFNYQKIFRLLGAKKIKLFQSKNLEVEMKKLTYTSFSFIVLVLVLGVSSLKAQTVVKTWDFEAALEDWGAGGEGSSVELSTDQALNGSSSLKLVKPGTGLEINLQNDVFKDLVEGDVLTYHVWISASDLAAVNGCQIFWQTTDSWNWNSQWTDGTALTGDSWTIVEHTMPVIDLPLQRIGYQLLLQTGNEALTPALYVDDITVSRTVIPVELVSFVANVVDNKVRLSWQTATEKNNAGFEIQRSVDNKEFVKVGYMIGKGTTTDRQSYSYVDEFAGGKLFYRLKQIDYDGAYTYSNTVEVKSLPNKFSLSQNYPNPFNPTTTISFSLPEKSDVHLLLVDVLGNVVNEIAAGSYEAGYHKVKLDASKLVSGVYFYRLEADNFVDVKKLMLVK